MKRNFPEFIAKHHGGVSVEKARVRSKYKRTQGWWQTPCHIAEFRTAVHIMWLRRHAITN